MKTKVLTIILAILTTITGFSQVPQGFIYQGVAHKLDGTPVANKQITVEVNILQGNCTTGCTLIWQELHYPKTNGLGVFTIEIGNGQNTHAGTVQSFSDINWADRSAGDYYLKIRVDFGASEYGNSMIDLGTSKILSVPYSLVAKQASSLVKTGGKVDVSLPELSDVDTNTLKTNDVLTWNGTNWVNQPQTTGATTLSQLTDVDISSPTSLQGLLFNSSTNKWTNTTLLLNTLNDVSITSPATGQILSFDGTNWINQKLDLALDSLTNVSISSPKTGDYLTFDGTNWINQPGLWQKTESEIFLDTSYKNLPLLIHTATKPGNASYADSIGQGDFVLKNSSTTATTPVAYSGSNLVYYGDFSSLVIGQNNINSQGLGQYCFILGENNDPGANSLMLLGSNNIITRYNYTMANNLIVVGNSNELDYNASNTMIIGNTNKLHNPYTIMLGENHYTFTSNTSGENIYSILAGTDDSARTQYNYLFGQGLISYSAYALAIGKYNASTTSDDGWTADAPVFMIGDGTDAANRSNAFVIQKDGDVYTKGSVYTGQTATLPSKAITLNPKVLNKIENLKVYSNGNKFYLDPLSLKKNFPSTVSKFNKSYAINYIGLVPVLVRTIQEQQKTIDKQQQQIDDLEKRVARLEQLLLNSQK